MENNFSAIKSIQELKNLLDSGAITQQEYEVLKQKIIFGNNNSAPPVPPPATPTTSIQIERKPVASPPAFTTAANPEPAEENPISSEYQRAPFTQPVVNSGNYASENLNDNERLRSMTFNQPEEVTEDKRKDWLLTILISLAAVLLIGLVAYQLFSDPESERLTSKSGAETEEITTAENTGAEAATAAPEKSTAEVAPEQQTQPTTPPAAEPTVTTPPVTNIEPATQSPAQSPKVTETTTPSAAAPKINNEEALNKIKDRLQAYYNDIKNPPFAAQNHFATTVERYYTLVGTTPQAINENISSYHFNEFQDSQSSIEDGSLKMVSSGDNGYEVTYIEHGSAFRKSKGQKQETTARVRARFDQDFKLTYFRQEQLLENRFFD